MASKRASRKRRKARTARPRPAAEPAAPAGAQPEGAPGAVARGYARSRAKDEAARAALVPLAPGERPGAVTVGAIAAAVLAVANVVALLFGYESGEPNRVSGTLLVTAVLVVVAVGMWRARYWAVLGMQTLLALTIIGVSIGLVTAVSVWGAVLLVLILVAAGTLFWFLVKAMARIQMPRRPGS